MLLLLAVNINSNMNIYSMNALHSKRFSAERLHSDRVSVRCSQYLPEEEVTEAHLPGGADEEVGVGGVAAVQTLAEQSLGHVTTPQRDEEELAPDQTSNVSNVTDHIHTDLGMDFGNTPQRTTHPLIPFPNNPVLILQNRNSCESQLQCCDQKYYFSVSKRPLVC